MRHYRATNLTTHEVVEYDADLPQAEHRASAWNLEDVVTGPAGPDPVIQPPPFLPITKLAFRQRFTAQERITIELASLDNPAASDQQRQLAAALRSSSEDVAVAQYIDLNRADTRSGVGDLEAYGLIAAGRATVILDTEPTAEERWNG